ncbi:hypothetical protein KQI89_16390 [Clostridium sp. MSJ-4]|uniref:Uncharacterized protein n=1 Tax=Clostridium simiarum TaxID=2841506 RepID=A0ABS6F679_9CLOT|nr:hypothetical protein [Clostridium simiarum]
MNTSYVRVQQIENLLEGKEKINLNTSHVKVQRDGEYAEWGNIVRFKYI